MNVIKEIQNLILESNNNFLNLNHEEFLNYLNTKIDYGFIDKNNKIYKESELESKSWYDNYTLQIKDRLSKTKIGHCWDFVELERYYFNYHKIPNNSYFLCDPELTLTHTLLIYNNNYWIESAWYKKKGIRKINNIKDVWEIYKNHHKKEVHMWKYNEPKFAMKQNDFINFCTKGKPVL